MWDTETKQKYTKTSLKIQRTDWCLPVVGLEVSKIDEENPEVWISSSKINKSWGVCVCVWEREREREKSKGRPYLVIEFVSKSDGSVTT